MKKILLFTFILFLFLQLNTIGQNAWINEIHYDNGGTDANEMIEVVIENPGAYSLSDFSISLYNGNNGDVYDTKTLDLFTVGASSGDFTIYYFYYPENGIQNGAPDGMSLDYQGSVVEGQFLSYEGAMTATAGPANGLNSADIGVEEGSTTLETESLQLSGTGTQYGEFMWVDPATATAGELNNNQEIGTYIPDPEPTNYPTDFFAEANTLNIDLTWIDAIGDQLPAGYLILASDEDNIVAPVDGTPVVDDPDLSDGEAAVNIDFGVESYTFSNLSSNTTYYFEIYPYTNYAEFIDYKNDGTPPASEATTAAITIINSEDFDDGLGTWHEYSVTGDQVWFQDTYGGETFAKMSGYDGGSNENEDWLISPSLNLDEYDDEIFTFSSAMNYDGNLLEVMYSDNYDGISDPNSAVWVLLDAELSPGSWTWTESGNIDLSEISGSNIYLAYKYTSTSSESSTWEIDDILLTGLPDIGIDNPISNCLETSIYPNPSFGEVNITFSKDNIYRVEVFTSNGEMIENMIVDGTTYKADFAYFAKGVYFIKITTLNSKVVGTKKLIIY